MSSPIQPQREIESLLAFVRSGRPLRLRYRAQDEFGIVERQATIDAIKGLRADLASRRDWKTPLAITITVVVVIPLTDWSWEGERLGIGAWGWLRVFVLAALLSLAWAGYGAVSNRRRQELTAEQIYERLTGESVARMDEGQTASGTAGNTGAGNGGELRVGNRVRHPKWGTGQVLGMRRSGQTDYLTIAFDGPPPHEEELIYEFVDLLLLDGPVAD